MKRFLAFIVFTQVSTLLTAAEPTAPEISLRVNGRAADSSPLMLWQGEPIIVEVVLRHANRGDVEPLVLDPPDASWATRVILAVTDQTGATTAWPLKVVGKPSAGALILQPNTITTLVLRLDDPKPIAGKYQVLARLNLADGRGWRGLGESEPIDLEVAKPTGALARMELGQRQLLRVRDALLAGEIPRAKSAAKEMVDAEFDRPEGFVATALVFAAEGKRRLALLSIDRAIALASGLSGVETPSATSVVVRKPVPFEYYDLRRRFEHIPSNESERETPATTPNEALAHAPLPPTPSSTSAAARNMTLPAVTTPVPTPSVRPPVTATNWQDRVSVPLATAPGATEPTPTARGTATSIAPAISPQLASNPADKGARDPKDFPRPERSLRTSYNSIWQKTYSQDVATYGSADALEALRAFYTKHTSRPVDGNWSEKLKTVPYRAPNVSSCSTGRTASAPP